MTKILMLTLPQVLKGTRPIQAAGGGDLEYEVNAKPYLRELFDHFDTKRYVVGRETGHKGYKHFQVRWEFSETDDEDAFQYIKELIPQAHVEESSQWCDYEGKEHRHWTSWDTKEVYIQRFGTPTEAQERVLQAVRDTNDRQVVVWYDPTGGCGKTWLAKHLWETGQGHYIAPTMASVAKMIEAAASFEIAERRPIITIDIPRTVKWDDKTYIAIETLKDGLITDPRYSARAINVSGVKVLVTTNTMPNRQKLSADRWTIVGRDGTALS